MLGAESEWFGSEAGLSAASIRIAYFFTLFCAGFKVLTNLAPVSHMSFLQTLQTTEPWLAHGHRLATGGTGFEAQGPGHAKPRTKRVLRQ